MLHGKEWSGVREQIPKIHIVRFLIADGDLELKEANDLGSGVKALTSHSSVLTVFSVQGILMGGPMLFEPINA